MIFDKKTETEVKNNFIKARQGNVLIHLYLGRQFLDGSFPYPQDFIQAKKHYLKAAILEIDSALNTTIGQKMLRYAEFKETEFDDDEILYEKAVEAKNSQLFSKEELKSKLNNLVSEYGEYSQLEIEVCFKLKDFCLKYVSSNLGLFKNVDQILPLEIKNEIAAFISPPSNAL